MTYKEVDKFYEADSKKYEIENNKEFLVWLRNTIDDGYHSFIEIEELQELIDTIVNWYEIKYPEREFQYYDSEYRDLEFEDIRRISNIMNIRQLLFRLPKRQLSLMKCGYSSRSWSYRSTYKNGKIVEYEPTISVQIKINGIDWYSWEIDHFWVTADPETGDIIDYYNLGNYYDGEEIITLDELLEIFRKKYTEELDFSELEECVYVHNCDMELRHRILQLVALKLLYSENTIPERGYERAKRFINEFNKKLGLTLSTDEIDEIMNRDYTNGEKWKLVSKSAITENGQEVAYLVAEDVANKEKEEENTGIKRLVKRLFNRV